MKNASRATLQLAGAMLIFGSVGLVRNLIPLPSGTVAMCRGLIGAVCLLPALLKNRPGVIATVTDRRSLLFSVLSGIFLGFNWMLLFEAFRYTTVAIATLSYYMAPVMVILAVPVLTKTRLTFRQWLCALVAVCGMVLISGVLTDKPGSGAGKGILFGLAAACLYAAVILVNRFFPAKDAFAGTVIRLGTAGLALIPYVLLTEGKQISGITVKTVIPLIIICVIHTGLAYLLYFDAVRLLPPLTTALMSYIDPVVAVLLSTLVLREPFGPAAIAGSVLLLGAIVLLELPQKAKVTPQKE